MRLRQCAKHKHGCKSRDQAIVGSDGEKRLPIGFFMLKAGSTTEYKKCCTGCLIAAEEVNERARKNKGPDKRARGNDMGGLIPLTIEQWKSMAPADPPPI
jgi:hypothetical protein